MAIIVPIETVTPVWTGDNEKKTSYPRATSFLGGLRFWTEALLRSQGQEVCSATDGNRCIHDPRKEKHACAACQIFGCPGLSRGFALRVANEQPGPDGGGRKAIGQVALRKYEYMTDRGGKKIPTWYLQDPGLVGKFDLAFSPLRPLPAASRDGRPVAISLSDCLMLAIHLLLHWGMLGAKDQYGYGLVRVRETEAAEQFSTLWGKTLKALAGAPDIVPAACELPSLRDFFFFFGQVKESNLPPRMKWEEYARDIPFEIRYQVRSELRKTNENRQDHGRARNKPLRSNENRHDQNAGLRHYFCGAIENDKRQATRFNMGLDGKTIYGWGHFPSSAERWQEGERDYCLDLLKKKLADYCNRVSWKEFDSDRDTCASKTNWKEFLCELANCPWR